jgi:UDP-2,3-diacylglucosamine pyrophosphatase LpxH
MEEFIQKETINTIILSDIHLGSEVSRAGKAIEVLKSYNFKRLILLGDIFDDLDFDRLRREHWSFLSYVRELSNPKNKIDVIWVEGNHDEGLSKIMSHLIGIMVYKMYVFKCGSQNILAIHGHQFDRFLNNNLLLSNIAGYFYKLIQKWGGKNQKLARYIKRQSKGWMRISEKVAVGAIKYAQKRKANIVICGHTHIATQEPYILNDIKYYNTGCFTDVPSQYIIITESGSVFNKEIY